MTGLGIFICIFVWLLCGGVAIGFVSADIEDNDDGGFIAFVAAVMLMMGPFGLGWVVAERVDNLRKSSAHK